MFSNARQNIQFELIFFSGKNKTKENATVESTDNLSNSMKTDEMRKEGKFKDLVKGCNLKVSQILTGTAQLVRSKNCWGQLMKLLLKAFVDTDALHNLVGNLKIFLWTIDQLFNSLLEAFNELWSIIKDLE